MKVFYKRRLRLQCRPVLLTVVSLWSYNWAFDGWRFCCDGSSTFSVCVSSELLRDGREGRRPVAWHFPVTDNERAVALRTNALRAYEVKSSVLTPPGPRSRVGTLQLNWVCSAYCPNVTYLLFGGRKALCCCCWCGTPAESNGRFYSSGRSASAGRWRSPSCKLGKPERWRPSRWPAEA